MNCEKESGKRFSRLYKTLNLSQNECAVWLGVCPPTIRAWREKEPRLLEEHRRKMFDAGVNPSYIDGMGDMTLPGVTIDYAINSVRAIVGGNGAR
jgi:DNA-binding XRE family transcriptional regulator